MNDTQAELTGIEDTETENTVPLHTPGPWEVDRRGCPSIWATSLGGSRLELTRFRIADVRGWGHLQYLENGAAIQDANADLLASAPALYKEVSRLRPVVIAFSGYRRHVWVCDECGDGEPCDDGDELYTAAIVALDAAVGKPEEASRAGL